MHSYRCAGYRHRSPRSRRLMFRPVHASGPCGLADLSGRRGRFRSEVSRTVLRPTSSFRCLARPSLPDFLGAVMRSSSSPLVAFAHRRNRWMSSPLFAVAYSPCQLRSFPVSFSVVGPYSTQSAMKMSVCLGFCGSRFDAQTSFLPSGENMGKESKVLL